MDTAGDQAISFNADGVCAYCTEALHRMKHEYFPNEDGAKKLEEMMQRIKLMGQGRPYDCLVGVSGGLDSSYLIYLGRQHGLRMLAVHVDDGYDTELAAANLDKLCRAAEVEMVVVKPDPVQYNDLVLAFLKAGVPNLAVPQDNILMAGLDDLARRRGITALLKGHNFSLECILQRGQTINACDTVHIAALNRLFGREGLDRLAFTTMFQKYIGRRYFSPLKSFYPLNYMDYNFQRACEALAAFADFKYYGGKHHESVLTRFMQCHYLPVKFNFDKRKSHLSSLVISGQISRDEALRRLEAPLYTPELREADFGLLSRSLGLNRAEFEDILNRPPRRHEDYPVSRLHALAPLARRFRQYLGGG